MSRITSMGIGQASLVIDGHAHSRPMNIGRNIAIRDDYAEQPEIGATRSFERALFTMPAEDGYISQAA